MKNILLLGATGSIGDNVLSVIEQNAESLNLYGIALNSNISKANQIINEHSPMFVYIEEANEILLEKSISEVSLSVLNGKAELEELLNDSNVDVIISAISGFAGLETTLMAAKTGKVILLANKESIVVAGDIILPLAKEHGSTIIPIDSEHSAIHQCLQGVKDQSSVSRLILTGSGGPFLNRDIKDFQNITPAEAIAHPIWNMGNKISVDSSTMMNKCLEIIEARWLFNNENIDVLVHPEGIVHSLVEFMDKSIIAQLSVPDMKVPIAYGLGFPEKISSGSSSIDFDEISNLSFRKPDLKKFPSIGLAKDCISLGGSSFSILNAANEECVAAFLEGKIAYLDIFKIISKVLDKSDICAVKALEDIFEADIQSREKTLNLIKTN